MVGFPSAPQVSLAFPTILDHLQLQPFDFSKLIDAFVRLEPSLPRDLKRHLLTLQEFVLEALAWQRESSLYAAIAAAAAPGNNHQGNGSGGGGGGGRSSGARRVGHIQVGGGGGGGGGTAAAGAEGPPVSSPTSPRDALMRSLPATPTKRARSGKPTSLPRSTEATATPADDGSDALHAAAATATAFRESSDAHASHSSPPANEALEPPPGPGSAPAAALPPAGAGGGREAGGRPRAAEAVAPPAPVAGFLRRVLKLAALRLSGLVHRLDHAPLPHRDLVVQVRSSVWGEGGSRAGLCGGREGWSISWAACWGREG
jgi:hypothetical protein